MATYDHQILVGSTTRGLTLARDQNGQAMCSIEEKVLEYQDPLYFTQSTWSGGHGQFDYVRPDMYFDGQSIDTTVEGKVFLGPLINVVNEDNATDLDSAPICFFWSAKAGLLLMATTSKIYHLDSGGWDLATTVDGTVAGVTSFIEYDQVIYAARGATGAYITSTDGLTWAVTDLTNHHANGFLVAPNPAGTQDVLWKWENPNQITNTTNGAASGVAWSSPAYAGSTSANIQGMFLVNNYLMVGKADGMWYYDSDGGMHPLMPELVTSLSTNNYKYITNWQAGAYFSVGTGLAEISSYNTYDVMGPLAKIDDLNKVGTVVGITSDKDWVFIVNKEGDDYVIYKGREITRQNETRWIWCPWIFLSTNACTTALVVQHSATDRRLWFGYGTNTGYAILSDNPLADTAARFAPSGMVRMSYTSGSNLAYDKMFQQSLVTETATCTATQTVQPKYRKDAETSMTDLTSAITTNGTVKTALSAPIVGNKIQFELDLTNREPATTYAADTGTGTTTIVDSQLTSAVNDYYNGAYVYNTTRGLNGLISDYVGSTKTITCASIAGQVATDTYYIAFSKATPQVLFFQAIGLEKPEVIRTIHATYVAGDTPSMRVEVLRDLLRTARTSTSLIKWADLRFTPTGTSGSDYSYVVMEPGYPKEVELFKGKDKGTELGIEVAWRVAV